MPLPVVRVLLLAALVLAPAAVSCWLLTEARSAWSAWTAPGASVDVAVVATASVVGAAVAGWLALGAAVSGACVLAGSVRRPALVPVVLHRSVALVLGVALAAGPASAGGPAPPDPAWTPTGGGAVAAPVRAEVLGSGSAPQAVGPTAPDPGWRPAEARAPAPRTVAEPIDPLLLTGYRSPGTGPDPGSGSDDAVTVRRGDTLWDLAARHLGGRATDGEIAAEWPRWYAANREAIGTDPDLIRPGQQLVPPGRVSGG